MIHCTAMLELDFINRILTGTDKNSSSEIIILSLQLNQFVEFYFTHSMIALYYCDIHRILHGFSIETVN